MQLNAPELIWRVVVKRLGEETTQLISRHGEHATLSGPCEDDDRTSGQYQLTCEVKHDQVRSDSLLDSRLCTTSDSTKASPSDASA